MSNSKPIGDRFREILDPRDVVDEPADLMTYECDGFPIAKGLPSVVVFPRNTEQVAACVRLAVECDLPIIPRGSGTGLTGGCVAFGKGVIICTSCMTQIIEVDLVDRVACVQAGVRNTQLTDHVNQMPGGEGLHFSPDPSSERAATIGGNAATNAGGIHTLKHGVSANHILGIELVLADGRVVIARGEGTYDGLGPDLAGLLCASEGTLGIITRVWVRLVPMARAFRTIVGVFDSSRNACQSVTDVIASGIIPAAMEMMDGAMVKVVEDAFHYGFPSGAQALLLMELDGVDSVLDEQMERVVEICRKNQATSVDCSADPKRRTELWSARKRAFGAIGRISRSYCTQDACVPRSLLPEVLDRVSEIGRAHGLTITNVFHAGDGNVHPILLFDEDDPDDVRRTMLASHEILEYCISVGGAVSGEHGVGVEKLPMMKVMFSEPTMRMFDHVKKLFDPEERLNAGKKMPSERMNIDLLQPLGTNTPGGAM
jgi:glycolate oxidase